jgi:dTDP-4-dehydrorhamnose reductase
MKNYSERPVLVVGGQGLVGEAVLNALKEKTPVVATAFRRTRSTYIPHDITDPTQVLSVIKIYQPRVIVHCANLAGGVDFCEKNPGLARAFHFDATRNLGKGAHDIGAKFIFISTECVFNGKKEQYTEEDTVSPCNVYGQCKAQSEAWIVKNLRNYNVVRTMSVFGWQPNTQTPNALMKAYFSIQQKKDFFIPSFRWGNPTYVRDLASALAELTLSPVAGLYHVVGKSYLNRYEWLLEVSRSLGWDTRYLHPQETDTQVFRPPNVHLSTEKFESLFQTKLHRMEEVIEFLKRDQKIKQS